MADIVGIISEAILWLGRLPGWVLVPIFLFILGLIFGVGAKKSARSAFYAGIGLLGLMTVTMYIFAPYVMPIVKEFGKAVGKQTLGVADAGVFTLLTVTWGLPIAVLYIPVGLSVNILLLFARITRTLDVDLLNYWCWGVSAIVIWMLTDSWLWATVAFIINEIFILKIADWTAKDVQSQFNMPGISIPHGGAGLWPVVGWPLEWIYNRIPGFKDLKADPETIRSKLGMLGEPWFIGALLGFIFGVVVRWPVEKILTLMMALSATMILFPRMVGVMMEGLVPLADAIREKALKIFKQEIYIGLDAAVLVGFPSVLTAGIVLVPIVLVLALVLPGNKVLPLADLAIATPFLVSICMAIHKKNVIRGIITGIVIFTIALYVCGDLAPIFTMAGAKYGLKIAGQWTSVGQGSHWVAWILAKIASLFGYSW